jgi:hypothetical protein
MRALLASRAVVRTSPTIRDAEDAQAWVADPDQHLGRLVPVVAVVLARAVSKEPISRWQLIGLAAPAAAVSCSAI